MATAMVSRMPGHWPRMSVEEERENNQLRVPQISTQIRQATLRVPSPASASSSRINDELFLDTPHSTTSTQPSETNTPSYLISEPLIGSAENHEETYWWRFEPPPELFRVQEGTSDELQGLIPRSIERLRTQHEEEERQAAATREVRPLARSNRVLAKPRRSVSTTVESPDLLSDNDERSDPRSNSATSLLSNDSGYGSATPEMSQPSNSKPHVLSAPYESTPAGPSKRKHSTPFGLSSLFRRKEKQATNLEIPYEHMNHGSSSRGSELSIAGPSRVAVRPPASPVPEISISESATRECVSCLDDFESGEMVKLTCHSYCSECFQRLISTALESETHWPAKCCLNTIPSEIILPQIDDAMREKYEQRAAEWSIPTSDRVYCSHPGCSTWIPPKKTNKGNNTAKCPKCSRKTCILCRGASHNGTDCPQDPALQQTIDLAQLEGWKRCYQCHAFVEHNKGCRHMTCRCKAEFCYICSARWRTCSCTDAELVTAQQAAEARRQERANREVMAAEEAARRAAAAEEERIILQMVADFERAEAEREAAAIEAQRRRDEEERLRREEERRRIEEERIAAIGIRFRQLTTELEGLNEVQRVLMTERYEFELEVQRKRRQDALDTLAIRYATEMETLTTESQKIISDAERQYRQEYRVRLAEEQRIEEEYVEQLKQFWNGKPDGEFKVRDARDELRQDQDKEYKFWDAYRRKQLLAIKEHEKRKLEGLTVIHATEIKDIEKSAKNDALKWNTKNWAEGKWVEGVTRERMIMLQEMERVEYGRV